MVFELVQAREQTDLRELGKGICVLDDRLQVFECLSQLQRNIGVLDAVQHGFVVFIDQDDNTLATFFRLCAE